MTDWIERAREVAAKLAWTRSSATAEAKPRTRKSSC